MSTSRTQNESQSIEQNGSLLITALTQPLPSHPGNRPLGLVEQGEVPHEPVGGFEQHAPLVHAPPLHDVPQAPQLLPSVCKSAQALEQHAPPLAVQSVMQVPQCVSVAVRS
jgi:hypothetical protein